MIFLSINRDRLGKVIVVFLKNPSKTANAGRVGRAVFTVIDVFFVEDLNLLSQTKALTWITSDAFAVGEC